MFKRLTLTVLAIGAGLAAMPTAAQADPPWERDGRRRWEHERFERDRFREERWERRRAYERQAYRPGYYGPPPVYYAPPPPVYRPPVYVAPGAGLYVPFR